MDVAESLKLWDCYCKQKFCTAISNYLDSDDSINQGEDLD